VRSALTIAAILLAVVALAAARGGPAPPSTPSPSPTPTLTPSPQVRGMTVSTPTWGREWASDAMAETLDELRGLGVNWIAIHPYAAIHRDGRMTWRELDPADPPAWLARPIREAHARGMKIAIKPHLAYWGTGWAWRGDIDFTEPDELDRFFTDYERWMGELTAVVSDADLFVVATELDRLTQHEQRWRSVIATAHGGFPGRMTWASNHDAYRSIGFWDALDAVGVQAYFPILTDRESRELGGAAPSRESLDAGWSRIARELTDFSQQTGKPILLTELGYNRSSRAPYEPWAYAQGGPSADEVQRRCLAAALEAVEREPAIEGAFLWKWFPGGREVGDFVLAEESVRAVIREAWTAPE
jgi:hypothetical protein